MVKICEGCGKQLPEGAVYHGWTQVPDGLVLKDVVARDLRALQNCEGIYMMKGWEKSKGARAERAVAEWLCLKVMEGSLG